MEKYKSARRPPEWRMKVRSEENDASDLITSTVYQVQVGKKTRKQVRDYKEEYYGATDNECGGSNGDGKKGRKIEKCE